MAVEKWKKISDELLGENPYWEYRMSRYVIPSGKEISYYYVHNPGGSMVVGINNAGKIAMVHQYRATIDRETLEFPAGGRQKGKTEIETAAAEFAEETQFAAKQIEQIATFEVSPGLTDFVGNIFIAHDLYPCPTVADETENLEVRWFAPEEIDEMIENKKLTNAWSLVSWTLAKKRVLEIIAEQK